LGVVLRALHRTDDAVRSHEQAAKTLTSAPADVSGRPEARYELASAYYFLDYTDRFLAGPPPGGPKKKDGPKKKGGGPDEFRPPPGERNAPATGRAVALLLPLVEEFPQVPEYRHLLARCYRDLGGRGGPSRERSRAEAVKLLRKLVADFPRVPDYRFDLCETLAQVGRPIGLGGEDADATAREWLDEALRESAALVKQYPTVPEYAAARARYLDNRGIRWHRAGQLDDAERVLREAVGLQSGLVKQHPQVVVYGVWLALMERSLGEVLFDRGELTEARSLLESATARAEGFFKQDPRLGGLRPFLSMANRNLADVLDRGGEPVLAVAARRKADEFGPDPRRKE